MSEFIGWFAEIGLDQRLQVGGKGGSLGELERLGVRVPPGFVVKTAAFDAVLDALEHEQPIRAEVEALEASDLLAIEAVSQRVRRRVEEAPLPQAVSDVIVEAYGRLMGEGAPKAVAVRSSATTEDAADASFAGLQDTYLWVMGRDAMLSSVRRCWASLYSVESISYRRRRGMPEAGVAMAVVVQAMVDARCAGVMFTRSPLTGDRSVITIEAAWGLGSAIVGGEVTPDRWVVGKITGEITRRDISDKHIRHAPAAGGGIEALPVEEALRHAPCLSDEQLQRLRDLGRRVERHYGRPQDMEWAVDGASAEILLLQSRPETVWSARDAAPVARAEQNPLSHVMSIFGGRS